mgnify:CR=1 FL=1|jgi:hypothetical protein
MDLEDILMSFTSGFFLPKEALLCELAFCVG